MTEHHDEAQAESARADEAQAGEVAGAEPHGGEVVAPTIHVDRYEGIWMRVIAVMLAIFLITVTISGFAVGFQVPGVYQRIDPTKLYEAGSPFAEPGLRELAPGKYEAYIRAQIWQFTPNEIRIPAGSTVTFYVTSQDVQHGIKIAETNINMMALPGQISRLTTRFDKPGTYNFVCHEYCGQLHHTMYGRIIVEEPGAEQAQVQ